MKIYFLGIGGAGMSSLAQYYVVQGHDVSGMDIKDSTVAKMLRSKGIEVTISNDAKDIPQGVDKFVYTASMKSENPVMQEAVKRGVEMQNYFACVGDITTQYKTISIAGTHGKTTTVGLAMAGLQAAGFDASMIGGAFMKALGGSNFHAGSNDYLVLESCEYKNHFHLLTPEIVLITNIEWEHVDFFPTFEEYKKSFKTFVSKAKVVLYHADDVVTAEILQDHQELCIPVPKNTGNNLNLTIPGQYNKDNAALTLGLAKYLELDMQKFTEGLEKFSGVARRQEYLGIKHGVKIYDDYGHHPTAMRLTLQAFREKFPESKIGLFFEPLLSRKEFFEAMKPCLEIADKVALFPIYIPGQKSDHSALEYFLDTMEDVEVIDDGAGFDAFVSQFGDGDIVLCMGAGKISDFVRGQIEG